MKTTDLMIGDWVTVTIENEKINGLIDKIDGQTEDLRVMLSYYPGDWEEGDCFDFIEPIPITPKILEKNVFKTQDGKEWACHKYENDDKNKASLYNILWNMYEEYLEISSFTNATGEFNRFGVCYVHELQNALKSCGIEKEIAV